MILMKNSTGALAVQKERQSGDEFINIKIEKSQAKFKRIKHPGGSDTGRGEFFLLLGLTALKSDVYLPLSIASGKKTTGLIYQIEGTAEGTIETTDISCRGEDVTQITLGTLLYAKIPAGTTGNIRLVIEINGKVSKEYRVIINRLNYKLDPSDARYIRLETEISTKNLKFF